MRYSHAPPGRGLATPSLGPPARSYRRHRPEETVLYRVIRSDWATFQAELDPTGGRGLPGFVFAEVDAFLSCGILADGFVRLRCGECGEGRLLAFSCKRRGFCGSCLARRMSDFGAHMVDAVIPAVPVRQWVLTLPFPLRYAIAYNPGRLGVVLRIFVAEISRWLRNKARAYGATGTLKAGGVTVVQRFGSALNLAPHFHTLMLDGVYQVRDGAVTTFFPVPGPSDDDVAHVVAAVCRKVARTFARSGEDPDHDQLADDEPLLAALAGASVTGTIAMGQRRGARTIKVGGVGGSSQARLLGPRCAQFEGFNLHANVQIAANDRKGLQHLARYLARPPIAADRLKELPDGNLLLAFKKPFSDGTTGVLFTPRELIAKLIPLIPRPRTHVIRYHGVLAPASDLRAQVVPKKVAPKPADEVVAVPTGTRTAWAALMKRVFLINVLDCPSCHGRMRVLAVIIKRDAIERILDHMGLPTAAPRASPARPPPQLDLDLADPPPEFQPDPPAPDEAA